jgi:MFS family permease
MVYPSLETNKNLQFSVYAFGIYSTTILNNVLGANPDLYKSFGWNVVLNLFYIPGAMLGGPFSDWIGPKYALAIGVSLQGTVGFIMAGCYAKLAQPHLIAAFTVVYGIFLSLGELGPGDNIGLLASKTCATSVRGQYYGIAAAVGKFGAFAGTYAFTTIQNKAKTPLAAGQNPFFVASALNFFAAILCICFIPKITQDTITNEDQRWRDYLTSKGWDVSQMGTKEFQGQMESTEDVSASNDERVVQEKA